MNKFSNDSFDSCPTYRQLLSQLKQLSEEQLDIPLTVELDLSEECIPGYLDITGPMHSIGKDIPVIRIKW